jgi:hypothetical protein
MLRDAAVHPPNNIQKPPRIMVGFIRFDQVIKNPVPTLEAVIAMDAATNRKPESVGLASLTACK